ncbi:hypothetical protein [Bacillus sp. 'calajunan']|uniref:hypothetical protein n=1 Tax=Bacillus sp. 'calajunan' TaxID=3447457 RepID=UPI003EE2AB50
MRLVDLSVDIVFKYALGLEGNENLLKRFLNVLLRESLYEEITDIEVKHLLEINRISKHPMMEVMAQLENKERVLSFLKLYHHYLDLRATLNSDIKINIGIQV